MALYITTAHESFPFRIKALFGSKIHLIHLASCGDSPHHRTYMLHGRQHLRSPYVVPCLLMAKYNDWDWILGVW